MNGESESNREETRKLHPREVPNGISLVELESIIRSSEAVQDMGKGLGKIIGSLRMLISADRARATNLVMGLATSEYIPSRAAAATLMPSLAAQTEREAGRLNEPLVDAWVQLLLDSDLRPAEMGRSALQGAVEAQELTPTTVSWLLSNLLDEARERLGS